ncbi:MULTISPECIES: hypothetical protein [unclassified Streptomyces]|uniref:hypothetical protein n=1 Tax=unclassified Streptomyces TaxID=2593676 RepID=UPI000AD5B925|nr:hypothetical protein [Streptomyces sp. CB01249]
MTAVDMKKAPRPTVGRGPYFLITLAVVVLGWVIAAVNTGVSYLALDLVAVPIVTGLIGCLGFVIVLRFLHCAWWLAALSALPALLVLVGSVQYAPEAVLDGRGVRETARITADSAATSGSSHHRFTLEGRLGELEETLDYDGDNPDWAVGDRIEVISDPKGVVPMAAASDVDPGDRLAMLVAGAVGWTCLTLLAGLRGFVRRRAGRRPVFDSLD